MDHMQAVEQLNTAHSEAIMRSMETGEPEPVLTTPLAAALILEYIDSLREKNAELGRRLAASSDAIARVSYYAGGLSQTVETIDNIDIAEAIMTRITTNPLD